MLFIRSSQDDIKWGTEGHLFVTDELPVYNPKLILVRSKRAYALGKSFNVTFLFVCLWLDILGFLEVTVTTHKEPLFYYKVTVWYAE